MSKISKIPCPFSKYKNLLGIPLTGIHKYRIFNTAIVDYIMALIFAAIVTFFTQIPLVLTTIFVLILGIILHMMFGVDTSTLKFLGLTCK